MLTWCFGEFRKIFPTPISSLPELLFDEGFRKYNSFCMQVSSFATTDEILSHHFNRRTSPLAHFFFPETKIPISAAGFLSRSTGKMANSPPPTARSHRPGCLSNVLDRAHWAMPYLPLTDFFPPLPNHSPHPQDVGVTHRRVNLIYPRSPPHRSNAPH